MDYLEQFIMAKKQKHSEKQFSTYIIVGPTRFKWKTLVPYLCRFNAKLIFIDGGLTHFDKFLLKVPQLAKNSKSIGDGDSSSRPMDILKTNQNLSDLSYCLNFLSKKKNVATFIFVGFLGGRIDHQLFNMGEISRFVKKNKAQVLLEDKIEFLQKGKNILEIHGLFSLASFEENQIKIDGACLYKSKKWIPLPILSSRGLSNMGNGKVQIESTSPLSIFYY